MLLTLRAVSLNHAALTQPITARFDDQGGTIGRSDQNTMALPDAERIISRQHAQISARGAQFVITNIGTANPIVVRNELLARGESTALAHGDSVRIGGYLLEVSAEQALPRAGAAAGAAQPSSLDGLMPVAAGNPFAEWLAPAQGAAEASVPDLPIEDIDAVIGAPLDPAHDPFEDYPPAPAPRGMGGALHPDAVQADRAHPLQEHWSPPRAAETPAPPPAAAPAPAVGEALLWAAFCRGAGIDPASLPADERTLHTAGELLRLATQGTLRLMALRSTTRYEMHAQVTMIRPARNNPLKFSPNERSALESMLKPPATGFVSGPTAMADAMNDLLGHAIGTMAGTRAALEGVLGRFTPAELENQLAAHGMLERLLPMARKARLWELYLAHQRAIRDEAQEDFHKLFGKAFLAAYEQQIQRLQREGTAG